MYENKNVKQMVKHLDVFTKDKPTQLKPGLYLKCSVYFDVSAVVSPNVVSRQILH